MPKMTIGEIVTVIDKARETGRPFVVRFVNAEGEMRTMTCLTSPPNEGEFVKGALPEGHRKAEDKVSNVATVFSLDVFQKQVAEGVKRDTAGKSSWRRIPLNRCRRAVLL